ncbi:MAG: phage portal protein [Oscillospiraceae bacterium]|nr:phage portal protein [Oscillospiraceae bacterium]
MEHDFWTRLKHGWNAFLSREPTEYYRMDLGQSYSRRPDRPRLSRGNERTIITSILNRMAVDAAEIEIKHVRLDENGRYLEDIDSGLNNCLNVEANIDQAGTAFKQDMYMSMLDEGVIAVVPIDTSVDPKVSSSYEIGTMRVAKIIQWYPQHVKVHVYDDRSGKHVDAIFHKRHVAIVENPFYAVMNEPNSTLKRLVRKMNLLDAVDEQSSSGKLDLIIQLPYTVKTETRRQQAEKRRTDIEKQLTGSKYGIAYTDGTERITQLNRPVENNLLKQIEYLTSMLMSQLGITPEILNGSADEKTMLNYNNRIIAPMVTAPVEEMHRKFLTKTARKQRQAITYFRDPFKLVPVSQMAEIGDKFTRNEIMTSNEIRQSIGMKPSSDPKADELRNKNLSEPKNGEQPSVPPDSAQKVNITPEQPKEEIQNGTV